MRDLKKEIIKVEQAHLDQTIAEIEKIIQSLKKELRDKVIQDRQLERTNRKFINQYKEALRKPYFGKLEIIDGDNDQAETLYIGERGVAKDKFEDIIIDWRSPIGALYYSFNGGEGKYTIESEAGLTNIFQIVYKRSLLIQNQEVKDYKDIVSECGRRENKNIPNETVYFDDYLINILNESRAGNQIKDIVATIQKEQNEIIRAGINKSIIIQGVAGSGKSSIALYRLSYLLYRYRDTFEPNNILILAPNKIFLSYIKDILPSLEIEDIQQSTFGILASTLLNSPEKKNNSISSVFEENRSLDVYSYKGSLRFRDALERYLEFYMSTYLNLFKEVKIFDDYLQKSYILTTDDIRKTYEGYGNLPFAQKVKKLSSYIKNWIDDKEKTTIKAIEEEYERVRGYVLNGLPRGSQIRKETFSALEKAYRYKIQRFKDNIQLLWKNYKKGLEDININKVYKGIFKPQFLLTYDKELSDEMVKKLVEQSKELGYEDLAPLLYIKFRLEGFSNIYDYIVIDEAQDLSAFQIYIIKQVCKSLTLLGDVTQSIYGNIGIETWDQIIPDIFREDEVRQLNITTSYRSTTEIMDLANHIISYSNHHYPKIIPIGRKGEKVEVKKINHPPNLLLSVVDSINFFKEKGYKKIAIIHKDLRKAESLYQSLLDKMKFSIQLISSTDDELTEDILVLPSYLTKGFEFDAVIIPNASDENYKVNELDIKLLFTSVTRAQHALHIFYHQRITKLLENYIDITDEEENQEYSFL